MAPKPSKRNASRVQRPAGQAGASRAPEGVPAAPDDPVEHPRRMPRRAPYRDRAIGPGRVNGYDIKDD